MMPDGSTETFSPNKAINDDIVELLSKFPEPSFSRMRRKIRQDRDAALQQATEQADSNARHTFREFLVAERLNDNGLHLEYSPTIDSLTPDWYDHHAKILLEVFTCERGGGADKIKRVAGRIGEKVNKYRAIVSSMNLSYVVAVHGDFLSNFDLVDFQDCIRDEKVFDLYPDLSGVIFFAESTIERTKLADGTTKFKAIYAFDYIANPAAHRPLDMTAMLRL